MLLMHSHNHTDFPPINNNEQPLHSVHSPNKHSNNTSPYPTPRPSSNSSIYACSSSRPSRAPRSASVLSAAFSISTTHLPPFPRYPLRTLRSPFPPASNCGTRAPSTPLAPSAVSPFPRFSADPNNSPTCWRSARAFPPLLPPLFASAAPLRITPRFCRDRVARRPPLFSPRNRTRSRLAATNHQEPRESTCDRCWYTIL